MKKINAKKIINIVIDIILFTVVFCITDYLMMDVIKSDNLWLELGIYILLYGFTFGSKSGIVNLWTQHKKRKEGKNSEIET